MGMKNRFLVRDKVENAMAVMAVGDLRFGGWSGRVRDLGGNDFSIADAYVLVDFGFDCDGIKFYR